MISTEPSPPPPSQGVTTSRTGYHVVFYDTSDEDNSHEASISILSAGGSSGAVSSTGDTRGGEANTYGVPRIVKRWTGALMKGAKALIGKKSSKMTHRPPHRREMHYPEDEGRSFTEGSSTCTRSESEDVDLGDDDDDDNSNSSAMGGSGVSLAYGTSAFQEDILPRDESTMFRGLPATDDYYQEEEVAVDLCETILQYQRTPDDFYLNIILAALKSGVVVNGRILAAATGSPPIIKILLDSGTIMEDDEDVQDFIQAELARVLWGDSYNGDYVPSSEAEYVRSLCSVKSARLNMRQMVLLRYSGFSFIEIMVDYPHLLRDGVKPKGWQVFLFRFGYTFHKIVLRLSLIPTLLLNPIIFLTCVYWFLSGYRDNGYWTILCYFVGYMAAIVTTIRSEQQKVQVYPRTGKWGYPDNYYVMSPMICLYKIILSIRLTQYDNLSDNRQYIMIIHDLSNGLSIQQMAEGYYHAIPQMVLQLYLFSSVEPTTIAMACWISMVSLTTISVLCGLSAYTRYAIYAHSCDPFGFALPTVQEFVERGKMFSSIPLLPTNIITRLVQFFTIGFCVALFVTFLIQLTRVTTCAKTIVVVVAVGLTLTLVTMLVYILVIANVRFSRLSALVALPVILIFTAFNIYRALFADDHCAVVLEYWAPRWNYPVMTLFAFTVILFLIWLITTVIERINGKRLTQRSIDYCFWQSYQ